MAADAVIVRAGPVAVPLDYTVPTGTEIVPRVVSASFDGSAATGPFVPTLDVISPQGNVVARCPLCSTIAAGGSAFVSWFPGAGLGCCPTADVVPGVALEQFFVSSLSSTGTTSSTVLAAGVEYQITVQGTYTVQNNALNLGTPNADAMFPTSGGDPRVSTQVGMDAECIFAHSTVDHLTLGHTIVLQTDLGSGFSHIEPIGGPFSTPQPNYLYTYKVVGQGLPVTIKIGDTPGAYNDNYGELRVIIQQLGSAGGSGSAVPAGGATGQVLTEQNGVPTWETPAAGSISAIASPTSTITVTNPAGPTADVDLPTTGVSAGAYGDATHVAQVTVDARGRVTAASSVPISGSGGAGGLIVLYDSGYLGADAASIDTGAGGIASGHFALIIVGYFRTTNTVSNDNLLVRFNNDSGANYDYMRTINSGGGLSGTSSVAQTAFVGWLCPGASDAANEFGAAWGRIPAYDNTSNRKSGIFDSTAVDTTAGAGATYSNAFSYRSTAAISRMSVQSGTAGKNIVAGSRLVIYGVQ